LDRGIAYPLAECTTMLIGGSGAIESVHAWVIEPQIPPPWNVLVRRRPNGMLRLRCGWA
jgi:hypothetical protein